MTVHPRLADGDVRDHDNESGATLVEVLVTVMVLSIAIVALLGGLGTAVIVADQHRQQAVVGAAIHNYAEAMVGARSGTFYKPCVAAGTRTQAGTLNKDVVFEDTSPNGYVGTVTEVMYWDTASYSFRPGSCTSDKGAQQVTLQVTSNGGKATLTTQVVLRKAGK